MQYEELNLLCVFAPYLEFWHDEKYDIFAFVCT